MVIKFLSRQQFKIFTRTTNRILKNRFYSALSSEENNNNYKYLLILDFEATCDHPRIKIQEIIEFPCLKININNFKEEARFHHYVRPTLKPILSYFCSELTGILQEMVDDAKTFPEVYDMFNNWREEEGLTEENSLFITSGDWDFGHMLPMQCAQYNLEVHSHMTLWTDIKKLFGHHNRKFLNNFIDIMKHYELEFQGRPHSGIDDCLNILQVVKKMGESGVKFVPTSKYVNSKVEVLHSRLNEEVNSLTGPTAIHAKHFKKNRS